jgi:hypothetical protein
MLVLDMVGLYSNLEIDLSLHRLPQNYSEVKWLKVFKKKIESSTNVLYSMFASK